jgi:serine/threonine protein kinase
LGVIFFEMLMGDTPWKAKNEKELLRRIEAEKIDDVLAKLRLSAASKEFLKLTLCYDKAQRIGPEELTQFDFSDTQQLQQHFGAVILSEKQLNSVPKVQKFETIVNEVASPNNAHHVHVGRSTEKRGFVFERSERRLVSKAHNAQNLSVKSIENHGRHFAGSQEALPPPPAAGDTMAKEDKKFVSKLLIAEVHFCRFLFKLSGQIRESCLTGLLKDCARTDALLRCFTRIIELKVTRLRDFEAANFLDIGAEKYEEYRRTSDFRKLVKIAKDYYERYSAQLSQHWVGCLEASPLP